MRDLYAACFDPLFTKEMRRTGSALSSQRWYRKTELLADAS